MNSRKLRSALEQGGTALSLIDPTSGTVLSTLAALLGIGGEAARQRQRIWWAHVVENKSDEEFERTLEYELTEQHGDVVLQGLRAALETIDNEALVLLARLTRMYLRTKSGARDRFFRNATRLLCDVSAEEIELLRRLVVWSLAVVRRDEFLLTQRGAQLYVVRDEHVNDTEGTVGMHAILELDATRALELLADYNLLRSTTLLYSGGSPPNIVAVRGVFLKLHRILTGHEADDK